MLSFHNEIEPLDLDNGFGRVVKIASVGVDAVLSLQGTDGIAVLGTVSDLRIERDTAIKIAEWLCLHFSFTVDIQEVQAYKTEVRDA